MKIVLAGIDNYSSTNSLGIQAMSDGIINKVGEVYPNAELILHLKILIPSKTDWRWLKFIEGYPIFNKPTLAYLYGKFKRQQGDRVEEIKRADRLIVSGDGIIADIFTGWGLSLAFEMMVAIENNIPCCFVNQSINVSAKSILGHVVSQFFPKCCISVREGISARLLNQLFGLEKTPISIDSAFSVKPLDDNEKEEYSSWWAQLKTRYNFDDYIVVGVRGKRPTDQPISVESWAEVIKELMLRFPSQKVVFVSSCPKEDFALAKKIQSIVKGLIVIDEFIDSEKYNYRFLMFVLREAHLVISDRYHQLILSMLVGTLAIPVEGNTSKTTGLFEKLNYNIPLLPILNHDKLLKFKAIVSFVAENYSQLLANMPTQSSFAEFDHYNEILNR